MTAIGLLFVVVMPLGLVLWFAEWYWRTHKKAPVKGTGATGVEVEDTTGVYGGYAEGEPSSSADRLREQTQL